MLRNLGPLAAFILLACERGAPAAEGTGPRELGRVEIIYPHLASSGAYVLEYQLASDTVFVDYLEAKTLADGQNCMFTPAVAGCLRFQDEPPLP